jgi:hypothetical protein
LAALLILCSGIALGADGDPSESSPSEVTLGSASPALPGRELEGKRTATSDTFELPDGAREARMYDAPINYRDAEGDSSSSLASPEYPATAERRSGTLERMLL